MRTLLIPLVLIAAAAVCAADHTAIGAKQCQNCHAMAYDTSIKTKHWSGFKDFNREDNAVAKKLGLDKPREVGHRCIDCHGHAYTNDKGLTRLEPVSCESCHGAAVDYIEPHNDKHDPATDGDLAAFLAKRRERSVATGMHPSWSITGTYRACFVCHAGTDEKIVNHGGHPTTKGFELLAYSLGTVRHWHGEKREPPSVPRQAAVYLAGQAFQLEQSVTALAKAKQSGRYRSEHLALAQGARKRLYEIWQAHAADFDDLKPILAISGPLWSAKRAKEGTLLTAAQLDADTDGEWTKLFVAMTGDLAAPITALIIRLDRVPISAALAARLVPASLPEK